MAQNSDKQTLRSQLLQHTRPGTLVTPEGGKNGVRCHACGHRCFVPEGFDGVCKVRSNVGGTLRVPWGYVGGLQVDPIEKKPFFHAYPGTDALSFGMLGCDFRCRYCQNWITSQALRDPLAQARPQPMEAKDIVDLAIQHGASVVTSTYNEPLITAEWGATVCALAKDQGLATAFVSNGNATPEVLKFLRPHIDLYKVDLKGFRDRSYRDLGGVLANVTRSIEEIYSMGFWLEIVTLLVPGLNDGKEEIRDLVRFLHGVSPSIPWHVTGFHGDYHMRDRSATSVVSLVEAAEMGREAGLEFVYIGNRSGRVGDWESTFCPHCQARVIGREGFRITEMALADGACSTCHHPLPGVWSSAPPQKPQTTEKQSPQQKHLGEGGKSVIGGAQGRGIANGGDR